MHVVKRTLPRTLDNVLIVAIGDSHLGDPRADVALLRERIDYIKTHENAYAIINGDILNNAVRSGVSDIYGEICSPMEAVKSVVELMSPIKDKIIAYLDGNHEARSYKDSGLKIGHFVAAELGILDRYASEGAYIFLRFGEVSDKHKESNGSGEFRRLCYTVYCSHGDGGGRKEGAKAIRLADMATIADADIYIMSHTHLPLTMKQSFYRVDVRNSKVALVEKTFVNTGAFLDYGGYAERKMFKPASKSTPYILLDGKKKKVEVIL